METNNFRRCESILANAGSKVRWRVNNLYNNKCKPRTDGRIIIVKIIIILSYYATVCGVSRGGVVNMLLVLSITSYFHFNIWGCMCSTGPFQYRWLKGYIYSSCYYHHQIGSIHLSHCHHIFPWLCVWDVCYIIFCYLLHMHSGKTGNLFSF